MSPAKANGILNITAMASFHEFKLNQSEKSNSDTRLFRVCRSIIYLIYVDQHWQAHHNVTIT